MMSEPLVNTEDRLDAIALVRAHYRRDGDAVRVLLDHAGAGMYLAHLDLTVALAAAVTNGDVERQLDNIITQLLQESRND